MAWVVDTCVVIDVLENDPEFGMRSAKLLKRLLPEGLVVCPVTFVELAPAFEGNLSEEKRFCALAGLGYGESLTLADSEAAHSAWNSMVMAKRRNLAKKRPVADVLIGGFAMRFQGIVTRNPEDFRQWFPSLRIVVP